MRADAPALRDEGRRETPRVASADETPRPLVEVAGVSKAFDARLVLRGVSLAVAPGQTLALLGPNGAGKTTLLRILATLEKPSSGEVRIAGLDAREGAGAIRRLIGFVGHQPHLYDDLTARENLLFFARLYGLRDAERRANALLARVGLRARAGDRVRTFSRGQAQRLALARGILHEPRVMLLDEPDTGLDEDAVALLGELARERTAAGASVILTTHALERGLALSDATLALVGGRVAYSGPSTALDRETLRALYAKGRARGTSV